MKGHPAASGGLGRAVGLCLVRGIGYSRLTEDRIAIGPFPEYFARLLTQQTMSLVRFWAK